MTRTDATERSATSPVIDISHRNLPSSPPTAPVPKSQPWADLTADTVVDTEMRSLARKMASESMVLLKNVDNTLRWRRARKSHLLDPTPTAPSR